MHVLLTMFTLGPGMEEFGDKLGENFSSTLRSQKGFKRLTMFRNDDTGECGGLSIWQSKEDAEAALATTGSKLKEALTGVAKGEPKRGVYDLWRIVEAD